MSAKNTVEVLIAGKVIKLTGYESEEYLQKVAAYLNHKIGELGELKGFNRMPADTKSLLLELNVSDDYFKAKKQAEVFEEDIQTKDKQLYDLKHEIVGLQLQIDKMKKSEEEAAKAAVKTQPVPAPAPVSAPVSPEPQTPPPAQPQAQNQNSYPNSQGGYRQGSFRSGQNGDYGYNKHH